MLKHTNNNNNNNNNNKKIVLKTVTSKLCIIDIFVNLMRCDLLLCYLDNFKYLLF